jgi:hypothetical protein
MNMLFINGIEQRGEPHGQEKIVASRPHSE